MTEALAAADAVSWAAIAVKALAYAATLIAAGSVLVHATLRSLDAAARRHLGRLATGAALAAAVLGALLLPLRASYLVGGDPAAAFDPMLLRMVAESPLGTSVAILLAGLALVPAILSASRAGRSVAVLGAVLACASFAFRGHAMGEPRAILAVLVTLHVLALAFWAGGLAPLLRATSRMEAAQAGHVARDFGDHALRAVVGLVLAGVALFTLLGVATPAALTTPYGQFFALKLGLFAAVLGFAAWNRRHLTPALLAGRPGAARHLRRSILWESAFLIAVLAVTATLTTLSGPPAG